MEFKKRLKSGLISECESLVAHFTSPASTDRVSTSLLSSNYFFTLCHWNTKFIVFKHWRDDKSEAIPWGSDVNIQADRKRRLQRQNDEDEWRETKE